MLVVTEVGLETTRANAYVNAITASKGWQFGEQKCTQMEVQHKNNECLENTIKVDKWKEVRVNRIIIDKYDGEMSLDKVDYQKYMQTPVQ